MNLQTEYMENSFYSGRKIFRRKWGTDKNKPFWIKLNKGHIIASNGRLFTLTEEDKNANDWCIYGANKLEQKMFINELIIDSSGDSSVKQKFIINKIKGGK